MISRSETQPGALVEHKCVLHAADRLQQLGHRITVLPVNHDCVINVEFIERILKDDPPDLLSVMAVNNEVGTVQPVADIAELCMQSSTVLHVDAVQAVGHGMAEILTHPGIKLLSCSGHKFGGPRGVGILIQRDIRLPALICGGPQEHGCRAGTENIAGVVGMPAALELCELLDIQEENQLSDMQVRLESELRNLSPDCIVHGSAVNRAPHITSVAFPGRRAKALLRKLDRLGIRCGLGSACTGCSNKSSHVLKATGVAPGIADATLRFSLGWNTIVADIDTLLQLLPEVL